MGWNWTPPNQDYPRPKPGEPPLHRAARTGDDESIRQDLTPLMAAVGAEEDIEVAFPRMRALIASGANVNAVHDRGYTVFMSAVGSGRHPLILEALLEAGADPHAVSELGYNAFHAAIDVNGEANAEGSVRSTFTLLRRIGVDMEHRNHRGHTPLARAIDEGTAIEVQVLVELGADPNVRAPLHRCAGEACSAIEMPLVFHAIRASVGPDRKLEALLRAGVGLDVVCPEGRTPVEDARARLEKIESWSNSEFKEGWLLASKRCVELLLNGPEPARRPPQAES